MLTREERLKMALELTRLVWDLKDADLRSDRRSDVLDVFEACYRKMETLDADALSIDVTEHPIVPAD